MRGRLLIAGVATMIALVGGSAFASPLRVLPSNPRWFTNDSGRAVYLTGSHVWWNLVGPPTWPGRCGRVESPFTYGRYLDLLARNGHNFIRLWRIEHSRWHECGRDVSVGIHPWRRTGPGLARDGRPRFDLTRFDASYFRRLRGRVRAAQRRGMYVSIMLFDGWSLQFAQTPWRWDGHPFNSRNNVNGIEGDLNRDGRGIEINTLGSARVRRIQERYVRKVVDSVNGFDNVLFEIVNESGSYSTAWQYHMIRVVKRRDARSRGRHPVGMTFQHAGGSNGALLRSPADWISPFGSLAERGGEAARARKVILADTDHTCGICVDATFAWRSLTRGLNPIYMDTLEGDPARVATRLALGQSRAYARRVGLRRARPCTRSSTGYCLGSQRRRFLIYQPGSGSFTLDLRGAPGRFAVEWFDPATGNRWRPGRTRGGALRTFAPPFTGHAVLFLRRAGR